MRFVWKSGPPNVDCYHVPSMALRTLVSSPPWHWGPWRHAQTSGGQDDWTFMAWKSHSMTILTWWNPMKSASLMLLSPLCDRTIVVRGPISQLHFFHPWPAPRKSGLFGAQGITENLSVLLGEHTSQIVNARNNGKNIAISRRSPLIYGNHATWFNHAQNQSMISQPPYQQDRVFLSTCRHANHLSSKSVQTVRTEGPQLAKTNLYTVHTESNWAQLLSSLCNLVALKPADGLVSEPSNPGGFGHPKRQDGLVLHSSPVHLWVHRSFDHTHWRVWK